MRRVAAADRAGIQSYRGGEAEDNELYTGNFYADLAGAAFRLGRRILFRIILKKRNRR